MSEILGLYLCCLNSTIESRLNPVSLSPFYKSLFQGLGAVNAELDLTLVLILISFEICCLVGQSCPTLYKPMDGSTPCFPFLHHLPELAQTHVYWVGDAIQPSRLLLSPSPPAFFEMKVKVKSLSRVRLLVTPKTVAHQAPLSMGFSRQEYWSGLPFLSPGDLPNPGIESRSPALQADALRSEPSGISWCLNCEISCLNYLFSTLITPATVSKHSYVHSQTVRISHSCVNRGWDGWMASLTQWTRVWASSGSWWWTGKPGVLQSMGLQRVGHDWATELWLCVTTQFGWAWPSFNGSFSRGRVGVADVGLVGGQSPDLPGEGDCLLYPPWSREAVWCGRKLSHLGVGWTWCESAAHTQGMLARISWVLSGRIHAGLI